MKNGSDGMAGADRERRQLPCCWQMWHLRRDNMFRGFQSTARSAWGLPSRRITGSVLIRFGFIPIYTIQIMWQW